MLSWAEHPDDLAARAMALLCVRLARAYYSKARKDGTVQEERVVTSATKPLLDATLRDWSSLVSYLGEALAATDAEPVVVPEVAVPDQPPEPVAERLAAVRDWWHFYDARQVAAARYTSLDGLVPPHWHYEDPDGSEARWSPSDLYSTALPPELRERIERLGAPMSCLAIRRR